MISAGRDKSAAHPRSLVPYLVVAGLNKNDYIVMRSPRGKLLSCSSSAYSGVIYFSDESVRGYPCSRSFSGCSRVDENDVREFLTCWATI